MFQWIRMVISSLTLRSPTIHLSLIVVPSIATYLPAGDTPIFCDSSESQGLGHDVVDQYMNITSSVQIQSLGTNALPLSPQTMCPSLHEDIAYTLTSLRSSLPSGVPSDVIASRPRNPHDVTLTCSARPLVFDPQLMPFAFKFRQAKQREHEASHAIGTATNRNGGSFRPRAQLEQYLEDPHSSPDPHIATSSKFKRHDDANNFGTSKMLSDDRSTHTFIQTLAHVTTSSLPVLPLHSAG